MPSISSFGSLLTFRSVHPITFHTFAYFLLTVYFLCGFIPARRIFSSYLLSKLTDLLPTVDFFLGYMFIKYSFKLWGFYSNHWFLLRFHSCPSDLCTRHVLFWVIFSSGSWLELCCSINHGFFWVLFSSGSFLKLCCAISHGFFCILFSSGTCLESCKSSIHMDHAWNYVSINENHTTLWYVFHMTVNPLKIPPWPQNLQQREHKLEYEFEEPTQECEDTKLRYYTTLLQKGFSNQEKNLSSWRECRRRWDCDDYLEWPPKIMGFIHSSNMYKKEVDLFQKTPRRMHTRRS